MNWKAFQQAEMLGDSALHFFSSVEPPNPKRSSPYALLMLLKRPQKTWNSTDPSSEIFDPENSSLSIRSLGHWVPNTYGRGICSIRRSWNVTNWNDKLLLKTGWPFPKSGDGKRPQFLTITYEAKGNMLHWALHESMLSYRKVEDPSLPPESSSEFDAT